MATVSVPNNFVSGTRAEADKVNSNFTTITGFLNDSNYTNFLAPRAVPNATAGSPPAVGVGKFLFSAGSAVVNVDGSSNGVLSWSPAFPTGVVTLVVVAGDVTSGPIRFVNNVSTSGCSFNAEITPNFPIRVNWFAIGW